MVSELLEVPVVTFANYLSYGEKGNSINEFGFA